jgi:hypothetical protein
VRNGHFINLLFRISVSVLRSSRLWVRRICGRVYTYGGIHSGCRLRARLWYIALWVGLIDQNASGKAVSLDSISIRIALYWTAHIMVLLAMIILAAQSIVRGKLHDHFE